VRESGGTAVGRRPRAGAVEAAALVCASGGRRATLGVVLGTGLGGLADRLADAWAIPARDTGWLPTSTATGHRGRLVCGRLGGRPVAMLQGRVHSYEGCAPETLARGVELLAALGVATVLLTNAAGGLRHEMQPGELLVISDHLDLVGRPWGRALEPAPAAALPAAATYRPALVERSLAAARAAGAGARAGVYAHLLGPSYETRAEYRMLRALGADAVGMSTVPEAEAARLLGLDVAAVSVVTNVARPDAPEHTDAEEVCRRAAGAAEAVWRIVEALAAQSDRGAAGSDA